MQVNTSRNAIKTGPLVVENVIKIFLKFNMIVPGFQVEGGF